MPPRAWFLMHPENVVLIVDDEPIGRSSLQALLAREGYRLETAPDGPSALRAAEESVPDLILLDVMMPGMDGFEVTRRIRASKALAEVPILLVTALDDTASRLAGLEAGADDFVTKPFNRLELRARIRTIIRLNRFRRLTDEREKYQRLFEGSPCGLLVIDREIRVRESNSVARELLEGWTVCRDDRLLLGLLTPKLLSRLQELLAMAAADRHALRREEFQSKSSGGAPVWFELAVSSVPSGPADLFQVAIMDRTAERRLAEELRQAQKLESIGQLAGGIAHDFNNLLTVINGFSMLAIDTLPPGDPSCEMMEQVYKAGERAAALTRQLLAFSRKEIISLTEIDLSSLVREVEKMLKRLIGEHLTVIVSSPGRVGRIKADAGQMEQVLFNLAVNARDAMPDGGTLTISTLDFHDGELAEARDWVRLVVEDTGTGMTPEVREKIFEPFFTTKAAGKGTGLGLATVYGIVQHSGGRIIVESEPGKGTRFIVDFPRIEAASESPGEAKSAFATGRGTETILLAEDEDSVRSFAVAALVSAGYTVIEGIDGEDALARGLAHDGKIHLLFTDAVMPRLGGRVLSERFLERRPGARVLFTSGYDDDAVMQHGILAGKAAFLQKPYTAVRLLQKIREVLDQ